MAPLASPARRTGHLLAAPVAALLLGTGMAAAGVGDATGTRDKVVTAHVIKVTSGDSLQLLLPTGGRAARLVAIDAPEGTQKYGRESLLQLRRLAEGRPVSVRIAGTDRFKRLLVTLTVDGLDVNRWMVQQGHAWAFRQYLQDPEFCRLEAEARAGRRGLWGQAPADWVYPSEWRRLQRAEIHRYTDFSGETVAHCVADIGRDDVSPRP